MKGSARLIRAGVVLAVVAGLVYVGYSRWYAGPMAELQDERATLQDEINRYEDAMRDRGRLERGLQSAGQTMLGAEFDVVEHRFRDGLSRVGEQAGLSGIRVTSGSAQRQTNPRARAPRQPRALTRQFRDNPDFALVQGTLTGQGDLEQVLHAMAIIESQPWIHRVRTFRLNPAGQSRDRFELRVDADTIFSPDLAGEENPAETLASVSSDRESLWRSIEAQNRFRRPPPPPPEPEEPEEEEEEPEAQPPAPPPPPPYGEWRLVGIIETSSTSEAVMERRRGSQTLVLTPGQRVLDAVFLGGLGERALFEIDGERFILRVGQSLDERESAGQVHSEPNA